MSLPMKKLRVCEDCGRTYNTDVTASCPSPNCDRDTWTKITDGLDLAWEHNESGFVVAIRQTATVDGCQMTGRERTSHYYQVTVRPGRGRQVVWPAGYPHHGGTGRYSTVSQAQEAAEFVREHIDEFGSADQLEVADDVSR